MNVISIYRKLQFFFRQRLIASKEIKKLRNTNISLMSSDCLGCVKLHDLGMRFNSPTVNLWFMPDDFVKFCKNLRGYLEKTLIFEEENWRGYSYPVARLGDIRVYFTHYKTSEEAERKWNERKLRVDYDHLYFVMTDANGCSLETMKEYDSLPYPHVLFTHKKVNGIECAIYIETRRGMFHDYVTNLSIRRYYDAFDWVNFFNSGDCQLTSRGKRK